MINKTYFTLQDSFYSRTKDQYAIATLSLLNRVGCVVTCVTWVAWVKFLRGLRGLRGSKYFLRGLRGSEFFLRGSLRGSKFFTWVKNFCVSQILFTRWYYFTRLVLSRQILTKPCLTSLVFLSSLLAKVDLGPVQHFRWRLLWHCLKADYLLKKELCLECCRDL